MDSPLSRSCINDTRVDRVDPKPLRPQARFRIRRRKGPFRHRPALRNHHLPSTTIRLHPQNPPRRGRRHKPIITGWGYHSRALAPKPTRLLHPRREVRQPHDEFLDAPTAEFGAISGARVGSCQHVRSPLVPRHGQRWNDINTPH